MFARLALLSVAVEAGVLSLEGQSESYVKMNNAQLSASCDADRTPAWLIAAPKLLNVPELSNFTIRLASECPRMLDAAGPVLLRATTEWLILPLPARRASYMCRAAKPQDALRG